MAKAPRHTLGVGVPDNPNVRRAMDEMYGSSIEEHRDLHQEHGVTDVLMPGINKMTPQQIRDGAAKTRALADRAAEEGQADLEAYKNGEPGVSAPKGWTKRSFAVEIDMSKLKE